MTKNNLLVALENKRLQFEEDLNDLEKETKIIVLLDLILDYVNDKDIRQAIEDIPL